MGSSPVDYFSQAIANGPLTHVYDAYSNPTPIPDVSTGEIASPVAQITNPETGLYADPISGSFNTVGDGVLVSAGGATAMADRATGQLEATAGATFMNLSWPVLEGFPATAEAQFGDTLFFTAQGASPTTLTTIGFTVHINGTLAFIPGLGSGSGAPEANRMFSSTKTSQEQFRLRDLRRHSQS